MLRLTSRGLAALLAAGVILIALALWVSSRQPSPRANEAGKLVLPGLEHSLNAITQVRLQEANGKVTTLRKHAKQWIVAQRDYPADSGLVRKLLIGLSQMKVIEQKTSDPANYSIIGVAPLKSAHSTGTRIDLALPGKTISLIVGHRSGSDASFVRLAAAKESLLVSPRISADTDPTHWLDNTIVDLPESHIAGVRVEPAKGRAYTVTRGSPKQLDFMIPDLPRGRYLSSITAANSVANALTSLTLEDVHKPKGTPTYPAHAIYRTFHGLSIEVSGRQDGKTRYIALRAKSFPKASKAARAQAKRINARLAGWELEILGYQYNAIFQPLDGLLKSLPSKHKAKRGHPHHARA